MKPRNNLFKGMALVVLVLVVGLWANAADITYPVAGGGTKKLRDYGSYDGEVVSEGPISNNAATIFSAITADEYRVVVDLSVQANTTDIIMTGADTDASISAAGNWSFVLYYVSAIDGSGTTATPLSAMWIAGAGAVSANKAFELPGAGIRVSDVLAADIAIAAVTLSTDLASPAGTVNAAVGDIIVHADELTGTATAIGYTNVFYYTE
jgi:hypothetical protein